MIMKYPLFRHLDQLATDRWARQGVRRLLRATWMGVCVWCIGLGAHLAWGWPLRLDILGALALAVVGMAVASLLRPKLSAREAARRLDRRFDLNEQLATAVEVAATSPRPGSIAAQLLAQSGQTAGTLRQRIMRRQRAPWNEVLALLAIGLVALGLWIMVGIGRPVLTGSPAPLPPLVDPQDPAQQFAEEPPAQDGQGQVPVPGQEGATGDASVATGTNGDPATLEALADALRDQGATRPAADALDNGDVAGAAQELRELADQAGELSQAARNDLAESLREAAERIEPRNPELAEQLRDSANGLRNGGQEAARALEDLAEAIEQLRESQALGQGQAGQPGQGQQGQGQGEQGQEGQGQGQGEQGQEGQGQGQGQGQGSSAGGAGDGPGEQRPAAPMDRMGVEGQPLPLDANGPGDVPAQPSDRPPTASGSTPGFTRGDSSDDQRVETGADPLRVPLDERDIVQEYFAP